MNTVETTTYMPTKEAMARARQIIQAMPPLTSKETLHSGTAAPLPDLGCVIMASGLGRRFGSNKLLADFGGIPLILHTLRKLERLPFLHTVLVTRSVDVANLCLSSPVVLHHMPYRSDTIHLGLSHLLREYPEIQGCFFCLGDQPLLSGESIETMALCFSHNPSGIYRLSFQDKCQSPSLFSKDYYPELLQLPQGMGGNYLAKKYPGQVVGIPARDRHELSDVDTPEDLDLLLRHFSSLHKDSDHLSRQ